MVSLMVDTHYCIVLSAICIIYVPLCVLYGAFHISIVLGYLGIFNSIVLITNVIFIQEAKQFILFAERSQSMNIHDHFLYLLITEHHFVSCLYATTLNRSAFFCSERFPGYCCSAFLSYVRGTFMTWCRTWTLGSYSGVFEHNLTAFCWLGVLWEAE